MMREPIHPGETLREDLDALGMSAAELARRIEVPVNRITEILNGRRAVTRRHGAAPGALLRDVGRVLAQPPEALRIAACGAEERRGDRPSAFAGLRRPATGFGIGSTARAGKRGGAAVRAAPPWGQPVASASASV